MLAVDERGMLRQGLENRIVAQLKRGGSSALVTYDLLSLQEIKENKQAAATSLKSSGAEALLIMRLVDINSTYRDVQPGGERYAGVATGFASPMYGWYDYYGMAYTVAFMNMSPTYGSVTHKVYLETSLFDLKTDRHIWSGMTQTVFKENMDRVAEMNPLIEKILSAMRKDGVIH